MSNKTSHELARELLAGPDLPVFHFDPSFSDLADDGENPAFGRPKVVVEDACDGMTPQEVEELRAEGGFIGKFIVIEGDQLPEQDRPEPALGIEREVCDDIKRRQDHGIKKYGQTVSANPLPLRAWLQHAYEEGLDQCIYLRRAMEEIDRRDRGTRLPAPKGGA